MTQLHLLRNGNLRESIFQSFVLPRLKLSRATAQPHSASGRNESPALALSVPARDSLRAQATRRYWIHFDIKRLARIRKPGHRVTGQHRGESRGVGYEYLHIAIDDHSRIAFSAILPDQSHHSAMRFFLMARAF